MIPRGLSFAYRPQTWPQGFRSLTVILQTGLTSYRLRLLPWPEWKYVRCDTPEEAAAKNAVMRGSWMDYGRPHAERPHIQTMLTGMPYLSPVWSQQEIGAPGMVLIGNDGFWGWGTSDVPITLGEGLLATNATDPVQCWDHGSPWSRNLERTPSIQSARVIPKRSGHRWYAMTPKRRIRLSGGPMNGWVFEAPVNVFGELLDYTISWQPDWTRAVEGHGIVQEKSLNTDEWELWFLTDVPDMRTRVGFLYRIPTGARIDSRDVAWPELHYTYVGHRSLIWEWNPFRGRMGTKFEPPTTVCADCEAIFPAMEAYTSLRDGRPICETCFTTAETAGRARVRNSLTVSAEPAIADASTEGGSD